MRQAWKKAASLLLALALTLSLGTTALAADEKTSGTAEEGPLGIVSAMAVELEALVDATDVTKQEVIAGNTFYTGKLNGVDVVLVQAGVGKVLAASCAETLIDAYHVGGIVFTGIAGGVGDTIKVMDMVIATELVQHDYGTETNDGFVWNGEAAANAETGMIPVDETLSKIAYDSACKVLGTDKVHQGVIATGDQFVASETYVKELQTKFNAMACEMEGAAVARVADQFGVPCAVIRCMSDKADGLAHDTYAFNYTQASNTSASVVMDMLKTIYETKTVLPAAKDDAVKDTTPRTAIISAMAVELDALVKAADMEKETVIGGKTFYVGKLNGEDVVMVQAGIGKVMAANGTAALLNNFTVKGVVFTGIAGGVGDTVNVMDMVIGTKLVQHDYGTETNDGFEWNGKAAADKETGMIPVDGSLSKVAYNSACNVLGSAKVHQGVIATGDQFISSETYVKELQTKFNALACEMEGAAVARVCDQYGVPCAVIRCMSDKADGLAHDTYAFNYTESSNTSASVVMDMMKTLSTELPFTDVKNTDWCFTAVSAAYADGLMGGNTATTFNPNGSTTRGQIAAILYRLEKEPAVTSEAKFSDVNEDQYYADAVAWGSANGIVQGYTDGTFAPNRPITREQLAAILYRYAKLKGYDVSVGEDTNILSFSDFQQIGEYAIPAMQWAVGDGVMNGKTSTTLVPKGTATRAQVASMLVRFCDKLG
ncbi:5'-methylthioadenosine/adenosylhomocysteine nucleosidase [uncultured Dysosmobacter sp.]|uniref:5'-methylthioadenosine/adenosylhomocysteine nucleosidase n=1 Tax=uncultured Dysosmobacter sp. TaxID=2591384 RepID=UPI00262D22D2|nr:5'-methylthioadenosine/adenosylhomocysteine nucleosidase [uncultured Dysosmobacter sp.]